MAWRHMGFPSGTQVVSNADYPAWLYVYGPKKQDIDDDRDRMAMCVQLADYLNSDAEPPEWLDDMERTSETKMLGQDGSSITAVGPMFDAEPPGLIWRQDESDEAKTVRAKLIDMIHIHRKTK